MAIAAAVGHSLKSIGLKVISLKILLLLCAAASSLSAANYFVTIAGLGGTPEYETQFVKWAGDLDRDYRASGPDAHVLTVSGPEATRVHLQKMFADLDAEVKPEDSFTLSLIGHGTYDGKDYKLNLPGPDITGAELASFLNRLPAARQLVVNMTSCSGASLAALGRKNRVVITATKSGTEKNAPVFARYWIDALRDPLADTDKNGTTSALEAFTYAQKKTAAYFEGEKLLATEHPSLSDTGTVTITREARPAGQGLLAASYTLIRPQSEMAKTASPGKQKLFSKKEQLEASIDRLKYQKAAMDPSDYKQQLTSLLLELAHTQAEIDK